MILRGKCVGVSSDPDEITVFRHSLSSKNYINIATGKFSRQFNAKPFCLYLSCHYLFCIFSCIFSHHSGNRIPWLRFLVLFAFPPDRFRGIVSNYLKTSVLFILASSLSYLLTTYVGTEIFKLKISILSRWLKNKWKSLIRLYYDTFCYSSMFRN